MNCKRCSNKLPSTANFCNKCGDEVTKEEILNTDETKNDIPKVVTKENIKTASQNRRFLNFIIDMIGVFCFSIAIRLILKYFGMSSLISPINENILSYIIFISYYILFEGIIGTTLGKSITKTKVVDHKGERPDFATTIGRSLSRCIPFDTLSFLNKNTIGWHDSLSKTYVVLENYTKEDVIKVHELMTSKK